MAVFPSDYALVIGINDYPRYDFPLKGAKKDAETFAAWLNDPDTGGGVPAENTIVLLSNIQNDGLARPVHEEIDANLLQLIDLALKNQEQVKPRRFYFYFSGHGLGLSSEDVGLCLPFWSDAATGLASLKLSGYLDYVKKWGLFPEVFFFLDCCRASIPFAGGYDPNLTLAKPRPGAEDSRHLIAYAATYTNAAYEAAIPGGVSKSEIRGFFTSSLLEALNGACAKPEGGVPLDALLKYLDLRVGQLAAQAGKNQEAYYVPSFRNSDLPNIILGVAKPAAPVPGEDPLAVPESTRRGSSAYSLRLAKPPGTEDVELILFGPDHSKIYQDFKEFAGDLPEGKYLLRLQQTGQIKEYIVEHEAPGTVFNIEPPPIFSPILLPNAATSHEYYAQPAHEWSRQMTEQQALNGSESGIFIFARFTGTEMVKPINFFQNLSLLDKNMNKIHSFPASTVKEDLQTGWFAFSAKTKQGQYYLRYNCKPARLIPLYCFPGWQTQIFLTLQDNDPLFETLRILTARLDQGFVQSQAIMLADMAFAHLKNPSLTLPPSVNRALLDGKFENPMLGILGTYLLLQHPKPELYGLLSFVLQNLEWLLNAPDSPDLKTLKLLADPDKAGNPSFDHLPMIAMGTENVIRLSIENKAGILPGSVFENMSASRKRDLAITSWCLTESAEIWIVEGILQSVLDAKRFGMPLDMQTLGRQLSLPLSKIKATLAAIEVDPTLVDSSYVLRQKSILPAEILPDLFHLNSTGKMNQTTAPRKLVTIYAPDAFKYLEEFKAACLNLLQGKQIIQHWDTSQMLGGANRLLTIQQKVEEADLVIGLISPAYFSSGSDALSMHEMAFKMDKDFIPVIAITGFYELHSEIANKNPIPKQDAHVKPLDSWDNRNTAWAEITREILAIIQNR